MIRTVSACRIRVRLARVHSRLLMRLGPVFKQLLAAEPKAFPLGTQNLQYGGAGVYTTYTPATPATATQAAMSATGVLYPVPIYAQTTLPQDTSLNQNRGTFKLDHKLTEKDQLSFTYLIDQEVTVTPPWLGVTEHLDRTLTKLADRSCLPGTGRTRSRRPCRTCSAWDIRGTFRTSMFRMLPVCRRL